PGRRNSANGTAALWAECGPRPHQSPAASTGSAFGVTGRCSAPPTGLSAQQSADCGESACAGAWFLWQPPARLTAAVLSAGWAIAGDRTDWVAIRPDRLAIRPDRLAVRTNGLAIRTNGLAVRPDRLAFRTNGFAVRSGWLPTRPAKLDRPRRVARRGSGFRT